MTNDIIDPSKEPKVVFNPLPSKKMPYTATTTAVVSLLTATIWTIVATFHEQACVRVDTQFVCDNDPFGQVAWLFWFFFGLATVASIGSWVWWDDAMGKIQRGGGTRRNENGHPLGCKCDDYHCREARGYYR